MIDTIEDTFAKHRLDSWSQEGEDLVLRRFFEGQKHGFYVDVGAHHPYQYSNTFWFYRRGWRGINIDPLPGCRESFELHRPRDINLEVAISTSPRMKYFMFNHPALNGLNTEVAHRRNGNVHGDRIVSTLELETRMLADILNEHLPENTAIDFLSVDVEGHDLEVLRSNDWTRHRPRIVLAEDLVRCPLDRLGDSPLVRAMRQFDYLPVARTFNTLFFERQAE